MSKTETLDLASLSTTAACDKGFELQLKHPVDASPLPVFITVVGKDSTIFRNHIRERANARVRQQVMAQRRGKDVDPATVEQVEADAIDLLAACTLKWRTGDAPTITHGGKALECNNANAKFLYAEAWIREQVDEAVADLGNFFADSSTTSQPSPVPSSS